MPYAVDGFKFYFRFEPENEKFYGIPEVSPGLPVAGIDLKRFA